MVNKTNVILVTINYRLGALGFLVYGSKQEIGGNYGLKVYMIVFWYNTAYRILKNRTSGLP